MHQHAVFLPLAQLNTSVGGPGTSAAAPAVERATSAAGAAPVERHCQRRGDRLDRHHFGHVRPGTNPDAGKQQAQPFSPISLMWIPLMLVVVYIFLLRPQRKQEKKRKDMISEVKKGDRVMTIGGMIARVVSIEGDEVVLKIDESANVKATYSKKAIQEVLDRDEKK